MELVRNKAVYRKSFEDLRGLLDMLLALPSSLRGTPAIEIGSAIGESTRILSLFFSPVYSVDPFIDTRSKSEGVDQTSEFNRMINENIVSIRVRSANAVGLTPKRVGFVYIDGDHTRAAVEADIRNYLPKVIPGGYIGGHDYLNKDNIEVQPVVDSILGKPDLIFIDHSWLKKIRTFTKE